MESSKSARPQDWQISDTHCHRLHTFYFKAHKQKHKVQRGHQDLCNLLTFQDSFSIFCSQKIAMKNPETGNTLNCCCQLGEETLSQNLRTIKGSPLLPKRKTDAFSEKFQTAFDPLPPHFRNVIFQFLGTRRRLRVSVQGFVESGMHQALTGSH